ncbi:trichohyalin, partial [Biomphalaria glabrata]
LPGDEPILRKRKTRQKLGEVVDTLLPPEHKAARRIIRRSQKRHPGMAGKNNLTLYERIMAYRQLKTTGSSGSADSETNAGPGSAEDQKSLERSDTGWGSVDISQYTGRRDEDEERRTPTPPPTLALDVSKTKKQRSGLGIWTRRNTTPKCGQPRKGRQAYVYSTEFCSGERTLHKHQSLTCLSHSEPEQSNPDATFDVPTTPQLPDIISGEVKVSANENDFRHIKLAARTDVGELSAQNSAQDDNYDDEISTKKQNTLLNYGENERRISSVKSDVKRRSKLIKSYSESREESLQSQNRIKTVNSNEEDFFQKEKEGITFEERAPRCSTECSLMYTNAICNEVDTPKMSTETRLTDSPSHYLRIVSADSEGEAPSSNLIDEARTQSASHSSESPILRLQSLKPAYSEFPEIIDVSRRHMKYVCLVRSKSEGNWALSGNLPGQSANEQTDKDAIEEAESISTEVRKGSGQDDQTSSDHDNLTTRGRMRRRHNLGWDSGKKRSESVEVRRSTLELDLAQKVILRKRVLDSLTPEERIN